MNYKSSANIVIVICTAQFFITDFSNFSKFFITDFFRKCDKFPRKLRTWSYLLKKS